MLIGPSVSEVEVVEAGEVHVDEEREIRRQNRDQKRELQMVKPLVWRLLGQAGRTKVHIRILARHIGEMVVLDIVPLPPGLLMDRRIPGKFLGMESPDPFEMVIHPMQDGVSDFGRLQLLVNPQRADTCQKGDGLKAEMEQCPTGHFHPA